MDFYPVYDARGLLERSEPVPFRLTRNLHTFFTPFGVEGVFVSAMAAAAQVPRPALASWRIMAVVFLGEYCSFAAAHLGMCKSARVQHGTAGVIRKLRVRQAATRQPMRMREPAPGQVTTPAERKAVVRCAQAVLAKHSNLADLLALFFRDDIVAWTQRRAQRGGGLRAAQLRAFVDANIDACVKRVAAVAPATPVEVGGLSSDCLNPQ